MLGTYEQQTVPHNLGTLRWPSINIWEHKASKVNSCCVEMRYMLLKPGAPGSAMDPLLGGENVTPKFIVEPIFGPIFGC
jgi:hypothetical protein